jgi:hypothetical protein
MVDRFFSIDICELDGIRVSNKGKLETNEKLQSNEPSMQSDVGIKHIFHTRSSEDNKRIDRTISNEGNMRINRTISNEGNTGINRTISNEGNMGINRTILNESNIGISHTIPNESNIGISRTIPNQDNVTETPLNQNSEIDSTEDTHWVQCIVFWCSFVVSYSIAAFCMYMLSKVDKCDSGEYLSLLSTCMAIWVPSPSNLITHRKKRN